MNNSRKSWAVHEPNCECLQSTFVDVLRMFTTYFTVAGTKDTYVFVIPKLVHGSALRTFVTHL